MSLAELKDAVNALSSEELTELASFIRQKENAEWDAEIERDFSPGGKHAQVLDEVRDDIRSGNLQELP